MRAQSDGTDRGFTFYSSGKIGTEIKFYRATNPSTVACAVYFPYIPDSIGHLRPTLAYDLMSPVADQVGSTPRCKDVGLTRQDLEGAGVDVSFRLNKNVSFGFGTYTNRIFLDGLELQAGWYWCPAALPPDRVGTMPTTS